MHRTCSQMKLVYVLLIANIFLDNLVDCVGDEGDFTNEWAIEVDGGDHQARQIATEHDLEIIDKIFDNIYHVRHRRIAKRSALMAIEHHTNILSHPKVKWAEQQVVKKRVKRDYQSRISLFTASTGTLLKDPKWPSMWYLNRGGQVDMNVIPAWKEGVTGKGIVVTILDDGLEKDHPDIIQNYDPQASYDVNGHDQDPVPRYDLSDSNRHGTRCAGEVAAQSNNTVCAVGVAYEASIGGVRMLDGDVTDAVEAKSLALNPHHIDIYSASWGPDDDGKTVDGPGQLATRAFTEGIKNGRNGKGSIFVWASGNGGRDADNCNCDGYTNSIWTLSISSATEKGRVPWYSEACSSTLATTYSSGAVGERQIITTDLHHSCTSSHTGTSASAPIAAGIVALALQANTAMTWRDMQHIVVRTARPHNLEAPDWQTNGVGRKVSHRFGYGLMDAHAMVRLAKNWTNVPSQRKCDVFAPHIDKLIPQKSLVTLTLQVVECPGVNYLEHVQAKITLSADRRGDIEIYLTSPAGTKSNLLAQRPKDMSPTGFHSWPFMTVHMWGEKPFGIWKLEIHNNGRFYPNASTTTSITPENGKANIKDWGLTLHGTETEPGQPSTESANYAFSGDADIHKTEETFKHSTDEGTPEEREKSQFPEVYSLDKKSSASLPTPTPVLVQQSFPLLSSMREGCTNTDVSGACIECKSSLLLHNGECVKKCPHKYYPWQPANLTFPKDDAVLKPNCRPCHYTCYTCSGPLDYQCTKCYGDAVLHTPNKGEQFCHTAALIRSFKDHKWYRFFVILLLAAMITLITVLSVLLFHAKKNIKRKSGKRFIPNGRYARLPDNEHKKIITRIPDFHDISSEEEEQA